MIKNSQINNSSVEAALYYVQLKTHSGSSLFDLPDTYYSKSEQTQASAPSLAQVAVDELLLVAAHRGITVDCWIVLPDALHVLVALQTHRHDYSAGAGKPRSLTSFVAGFKAATAKRINLLRNQPGSPVWQRSYKEQLITDEVALNRLKVQINRVDSVVMSSQTV